MADNDLSSRSDATMDAPDSAASMNCSGMVSEQMKIMLDKIDNVRSRLAGLKNGVRVGFYEEILEALPQFVVCGPQSAGKSSVIRRISGVALPEASTLCTRVATLIQMRRSDDAPTRVELQGPDGEIISQESSHDMNKVRDAIAKAQATAVSRSPGQEFVDDHTIKVYVCGPQSANVTLVDLPGFHTADDDATKKVNAMVKRYIDMPGTLVLHVVKGDQDYASLLGNDFMRHAGKIDGGHGRVTVLTHCDKLKAESPADRKRLQATLNTTDNSSSLTVALCGNAKDDADEDTQLQHLGSLERRLALGAAELRDHLEDRMREHLAIQYPKAIKKLRACLTTIRTEVADARVQRPVDVMFQLSKQLEAAFRARSQDLLNELRPVLNKLTWGIKNFTLKAVTGAEDTSRKRDKFDEPLQIGSEVWYNFEGPKVRAELAEVTAIANNILSVQRLTDLKKASVNIVDVWSAETSHMETMVQDIKKLAENRGMRNLAHVDPHPIIARYAKEFASWYEVKLNMAIESIAAKLSSFFDSLFSTDIPDMAKAAATQMRHQMRHHQQKVLDDAKRVVDAMVCHNRCPDLIFTSNEHYLQDLTQKMIAADNQMATDDSGARKIFHDVRAYLKVQRKHIAEMASKELVRTMFLGSGCGFGEVVESASKWVECVKEPRGMVRKRKELLRRQEVLESALELVQS